MKLCVLVTTMHQTDLSIYKKMNLQTDAVIANQCDRNEIIEQEIDGHRVKMVCTDSRGLSRNRNIAYAHCFADTDYILFADDDVVFADGYAQKIAQEFAAHCEAQAIQFNLHDLSDTRKIAMRRIECYEKATRRKISACGVWGCVISSAVYRKHNLHFHEQFGAGTENYSGEDTIFLMNMLDKKIRFFRSPVDIAGIDQTTSTWFEGFTERYFITNGMIIAECYPHLCYLIVVRSAYRFSRREVCSFSFGKLLKLYNQGIKNNKKK